MSQKGETPNPINDPMKEKDLSCYHPGVNPRKIQFLTKHMHPKSVLDVGCGNGLYTLDCQHICPSILQVDIVDRRNKQATKLPFRTIDAENISKIEQSFDNIIAFDLIEHLDDDVKFLKSVYNLLNSGGKLFVSVPNEDNSLLKKLNLAHIHFTDKTHRREYSATTLQTKLEEAGFCVIEIVPHINNSIVKLPKILEKNTLLSRIIAKLITYQIRGLEKLGIFENRVVADWFAVVNK